MFCLKSIETEAVFTKTEMNNDWNLIVTVSIKLSIGQSKFETPLLTQLNHHSFCYILKSLNLERNFQFSQMELGVMSREKLCLYNLTFC